MTATAIDSTVFRHIFSSEPMRQVFSDEKRVQCYLDIEAALAQVQARLGLIPERAANEITAKCTLEIIDMAELKVLATAQEIHLRPARLDFQRLIEIIDGFGVFRLRDVNSPAHIITLRIARRCFHRFVRQLEGDHIVSLRMRRLRFVHQALGVVSVSRASDERNENGDAEAAAHREFEVDRDER